MESRSGILRHVSFPHRYNKIQDQCSEVDRSKFLSEAGEHQKREKTSEPKITVETGLNADAIRRIFFFFVSVLFQKHVGKCMD